MICARLSVLCSLASKINDTNCLPFSEHCELASWMVNSASIIRKKGATATQAAALNKQIKHIDQANQP
jgi:hypothetical protein